mgnify:CR=1 FL=1
MVKRGYQCFTVALPILFVLDRDQRYPYIDTTEFTAAETLSHELFDESGLIPAGLVKHSTADDPGVRSRRGQELLLDNADRIVLGSYQKEWPALGQGDLNRPLCGSSGRLTDCQGLGAKERGRCSRKREPIPARRPPSP